MQDPQITLALLKLTSGALAFMTLTFIFTVLGNRNKKNKKVNTEDSSWTGKEELEIVDVIQETHDIKTFRFKRKNNKRFEMFKPGQFLSFQIGDDPKVARSYSISGSCENTSTLQVSIKLLEGGVGSGYFHALKVGDIVLAHAPSGHFTDQENLVDSVYIAGGIGITPNLSMIKTALDRSEKRNLYLFYGAKKFRDLAFHDELNVLEKSYANFKYFPILSDKDLGWEGDSGFITLEFIKSKIDLDHKMHFYFCGPPIMTDKIIAELTEGKFNPTQIHTEKFASPTILDDSTIQDLKTQVIFENTSYEYSGKKTILEFLEDEGVAMDSACRSGVCGACKCKLISGDVDQMTDAGLNQSEKSEGYILSCVSRPKNKVELKL